VKVELRSSLRETRRYFFRAPCLLWGGRVNILNRTSAGNPADSFYCRSIRLLLFYGSNGKEKDQTR
jgi:hypothetical protein